MKVSVADLIEWEEGVTLSPAYRRRVKAAAGVPTWEQSTLPYTGRRW